MCRKSTPPLILSRPSWLRVGRMRKMQRHVIIDMLIGQCATVRDDEPTGKCLAVQPLQHLPVAVLDADTTGEERNVFAISQKIYPATTNQLALMRNMRPDSPIDAGRSIGQGTASSRSAILNQARCPNQKQNHPKTSMRKLNRPTPADEEIGIGNRERADKLSEQQAKRTVLPR